MMRRLEIYEFYIEQSVIAARGAIQRAYATTVQNNRGANDTAAPRIAEIDRWLSAAKAEDLL
jgi:hypothetical protein